MEQFAEWRDFGRNLNMETLNVYGVGKFESNKKNMEQFAEWRDFGRNLNMEHATRWVIKKVTSNQKMVIALHDTL